MRASALILGLTLALATSAAGLSLAQDTDTNRTGPSEQAPAPPVAPAPAAPAVQPSPAGIPGVPPEESAPPPPSEENAVEEAPPPAAPTPPAAPKPPPEPMKRARYTTAVLQALDKVTAETLRFEVKVNQPVRYKDLILTVHACETTAPDEPVKDSIVHLDVQSQPEALPGRPAASAKQVFRGWMFANSPGLHPFESPNYDVWLIACKTDAPAAPTVASVGASR